MKAVIQSLKTKDLRHLDNLTDDEFTALKLAVVISQFVPRKHLEAIQHKYYLFCKQC